MSLAAAPADVDVFADCWVATDALGLSLPTFYDAGMHNPKPESSVSQLHQALYESNKYPDLWFRWLGKP